MKTAQYLKNNRFIKDVLQLTGGSITCQIVALLAIPALTRLYSPQDWGVFGTYSSILGVTMVLAMLRYELAIPICEDLQETACTAVLAICVSACFNVAIVLAAAICKLSGLAVSADNHMLSIVWLVPVGTFIASIYQLYSVWAIRQREFRILAKTKVIQSLGMTIIQLFLGVLGIGYWGLIAGHIFGQSGGIGSLNRSITKHYGRFWQAVTWKGIMAAAVRFKRFPLYSSGAVTLSAVSGNSVLVFIGLVFGQNSAGWYLLAQRLFLPVTLLTANVSQVLLAELAHKKAGGEAAIKRFLRNRLMLLTLSGVALIGLLCGAADIVVAVCGSEWANSVVVFRILSPMMLAAYIVSPTGYILDVFERQDLHLLRECIRAILNISSLIYIYLYSLNWQSALYIISFVGVINYAVYGIVSWRAIKCERQELI